MCTTFEKKSRTQDFPWQGQECRRRRVKHSIQVVNVMSSCLDTLLSSVETRCIGPVQQCPFFQAVLMWNPPKGFKDPASTLCNSVLCASFCLKCFQVFLQGYQLHLTSVCNGSIIKSIITLESVWKVMTTTQITNLFWVPSMCQVPCGMFYTYSFHLHNSLMIHSTANSFYCPPTKCQKVF